MIVAPEFWKKTTIILGSALLASQIFDISLKPEIASLAGLALPQVPQIPASTEATNQPRTTELQASPTAVSLVSQNLTGLSLNEEGYNQLLTWEKEIELSQDQLAQFADFDVSMPCCGFQKTLADYQNNCACGHHLATYGLIKKMLTQNYSRDQIQDEVNRWIKYFYPEKGEGSAGSC